jgi:hypothetical protein
MCTCAHQRDEHYVNAHGALVWKDFTKCYCIKFDPPNRTVAHD